MKLKKKFQKCLQVFNFKLIYLFIFLILGCNNSENNSLPFKAELIEGGMFSSEDFKGKPLIINFWYPSCPPCAKELPTLVKYHNENLKNVKDNLGNEIIRDVSSPIKKDSHLVILKGNISPVGQ